MKRLVLVFLIVLMGFASLGAAEQDYLDPLPLRLSPESRISLVTLGPGDQPYTIFGHTLIRIVDPKQDIDYMVNYGVYNSSDKNFYLKFLQGTALYYGAVQYTQVTIARYSFYGIPAIEQQLRMTTRQRNMLLELIRESLKPENKYYRYDFFGDNCATRVRDLLDVATNNALDLESEESLGYTIRKWIDTKSLPQYPHYDYLFDILLGRDIDVPVGHKDEMFLPDMLARGLGESIIAEGVGQGTPLVIETNALNIYGDNLLIHLEDRNSFFSEAESGEMWTIDKRKGTLLKNPSLWWWVLAILVATMVVLSRTMQRGRLAISISFGIYLTLLGILGVVFLFAQFFSLHEVTHKNMHLFWMWPTHLLAFVGIFWKRLRNVMNLYTLFWFMGIIIGGIYILVKFPTMGAFLPMQITGVILGIGFLLPPLKK